MLARTKALKTMHGHGARFRKSHCSAAEKHQDAAATKGKYASHASGAT